MPRAPTRLEALSPSYSLNYETREMVSMSRIRFTLSCAVLALFTLVPELPAQDWGPSRVGVTAARSAEVQEVIYLAGSVQARNRALVAGEIPGVVEQLAVGEGDFVRRGAVLVRLRNQAMTRDHEGAVAQLEEAQARLKLAQAAFERSRGLRDSGVISSQQFDDAETEVGAWQGRADQAQALINRLGAQLAATVVRAPFSGVVVREHCQPGEWVAAGGAVVEMVDTRRLEIVVNVPERHFSGVRTGAKARVSFEALPEVDLEGEVTAIIPRADPQTRSFPVKVSIDNSEGLVGGGMSAAVAFPGSAVRPATIVPKDAVVSEGATRAVYRIEEGPPGDDGSPTQVANMAPVVLGAGVGQWIEVQGVSVGDSIVTRGNERLAPGSQVIVEPIEYPEP